MVEGVRQTRVCADDDAASGRARPTARASRTSGRGGQRTGRLVNIEQSGHVWVQVSDGAASYALRCMAMAPFEEEDLGGEVLVWEHSCGVGVVIGRGLDAAPPDLRHTRESFAHTMEVQPHEVEELAPAARVAAAASIAPARIVVCAPAS